jgi:SAM-dependent methyltransferase
MNAMRDPRIATVAMGYDALGRQYDDWAAGITDDPRHRWLARFESQVAAGSGVLEIGCGAAETSTPALAERYTLTAVDISAVQVERARVRAPTATFLIGDILDPDLEFPSGSFDGVVAMYSIVHIPRDRQPQLFKQLATWLRAGGWLLATFTAHDTPDWTGDWLGQPMFFSGFDGASNVRNLRDEGLDVVDAAVETTHEPDEDVEFQWVLARRRGSVLPGETVAPSTT